MFAGLTDAADNPEIPCSKATSSEMQSSNVNNSNEEVDNSEELSSSAISSQEPQTDDEASRAADRCYDKRNCKGLRNVKTCHNIAKVATSFLDTGTNTNEFSNLDSSLSTNLGIDLTTNTFGLGLLQNGSTSPPPHSYRHSRAYRHFKNPPQPHMCIRTTTEAGEELFINVLSWTRIVIPQEPSDPIPLYGGMRVPPGSPRSPPIIFAVMANPEVLKYSGRHSKDPEERRAMVELMCDFVEAMNPGVKLVRNAVILKDRDISGELKDVWNAVQAQRDREREEQIIQQRQQLQHYTNATNSCTDGVGNNAIGLTTQLFPKLMITIEGSPTRNRKLTDAYSLLSSTNDTVQTTEQTDNRNMSILSEHFISSNDAMTHSYLKLPEDGNTNTGKDSNTTANFDKLIPTNQEVSNTNDCLEHTAVNAVTDAESSSGANASLSTTDLIASTENASKTDAKSKASDVDETETAEVKAAVDVAASNPTRPTETSSSPTRIQTLVRPAVTTKKDILAGLFPNACIFPRFKHSKHKDKDKDKDKDKERDNGKAKEKERKPLLNALKCKSKEKKLRHIEHNHEHEHKHKTKLPTSSTTSNTSNDSSFNKNCLNQLECEVQKLEITNIDSTTKATNAGSEVGVH